MSTFFLDRRACVDLKWLPSYRKRSRLLLMISAILRVITTVGIMIVNMGSHSHGTGCGWEEISVHSLELA